jgi:hypothetical protein
MADLKVDHELVFFISAVLIEKILRIQPDTGKLFLILRADNPVSALKRLQNEVRYLLCLLMYSCSITEINRCKFITTIHGSSR